MKKELFDIKKNPHAFRQNMTKEKKEILKSVEAVRKTIDVNLAPDKKPEIQIEPEIEKIIDKVEPTLETEPDIAPASDILDDIGLTEGDLTIKPNPAPISNPMDNVLPKPNIIDQDDAQTKRSKDLARADSFINILDILAPLGCGWGDGGGITQDNISKYKLDPTYKTAIKTNLFEIFQLSKKKSNPWFDLVMLILACYVPAGATVYSTRKKRNSDAETKNDRELISALQNEVMQLRSEKVYNPNPNEYKAPKLEEIYKAPLKNVTKDFVMNDQQKQKLRSHLIKFRKVTNAETGEVYTGGGGRVPVWVKQQFI